LAEVVESRRDEPLGVARVSDVAGDRHDVSALPQLAHGGVEICCVARCQDQPDSAVGIDASDCSTEPAGGARDQRNCCRHRCASSSRFEASPGGGGVNYERRVSAEPVF
jgi:hypothetical protein